MFTPLYSVSMPRFSSQSPSSQNFPFHLQSTEKFDPFATNTLAAWPRTVDADSFSRSQAVRFGNTEPSNKQLLWGEATDEQLKALNSLLIGLGVPAEQVDRFSTEQGAEAVTDFCVNTLHQPTTEKRLLQELAKQWKERQGKPAESLFMALSSPLVNRLTQLANTLQSMLGEQAKAEPLDATSIAPLTWPTVQTAVQSRGGQHVLTTLQNSLQEPIQQFLASLPTNEPAGRSNVNDIPTVRDIFQDFSFPPLPLRSDGDQKNELDPISQASAQVILEDHLHFPNPSRDLRNYLAAAIQLKVTSVERLAYLFNRDEETVREQWNPLVQFVRQRLSLPTDERISVLDVTQTYIPQIAPETGRLIQKLIGFLSSPQAGNSVLKSPVLSASLAPAPLPVEETPTELIPNEPVVHPTALPTSQADTDLPTDTSLINADSTDPAAVTEPEPEASAASVTSLPEPNLLAPNEPKVAADSVNDGRIQAIDQQMEALVSSFLTQIGVESPSETEVKALLWLAKYGKQSQRKEDAINHSQFVQAVGGHYANGDRPATFLGRVYQQLFNADNALYHGEYIATQDYLKRTAQALSELMPEIEPLQTERSHILAERRKQRLRQASATQSPQNEKNQLVSGLAEYWMNEKKISSQQYPMVQGVIEALLFKNVRTLNGLYETVEGSHGAVKSVISKLLSSRGNASPGANNAIVDSHVLALFGTLIETPAFKNELDALFNTDTASSLD
ncbi:MAG: hypothetical protein SFZ03_00180 [Candidatus Melainabacteria bacterium]|nr:hypothetical protein [Candidatus Melainabacteria bacterium]